MRTQFLGLLTTPIKAAHNTQTTRDSKQQLLTQYHISIKSSPQAHPLPKSKKGNTTKTYQTNRHNNIIYTPNLPPQPHTRAHRKSDPAQRQQQNRGPKQCDSIPCDLRHLCGSAFVTLHSIVLSPANWSQDQFQWSHRTRQQSRQVGREIR